MERLKRVRPYIDMVEKAPNIKQSREAIAHFVKAMNDLDRFEYNGIGMRVLPETSNGLQ